MLKWDKQNTLAMANPRGEHTEGTQRTQRARAAPDPLFLQMCTITHVLDKMSENRFLNDNSYYDKIYIYYSHIFGD